MKASLRTAFLLLTLITLDSWRSATVESCGITIHNEIAFRASRILIASVQDASFPASSLSSQPQSTWPGEAENQSRSRSLYDYIPLLELRESLFAGSFFPDWGYNCIGKIWNEAAEEAHWPPFVEEAVRYILETYPQPWTDHAKDLIAFLFGTVSHSVGDMSWHALHGLDAGFIKAIAKTSFDGDYYKGHTLADVGAEFVLSHMSKMEHLVIAWKVPVKDVSAIYKRMGYYVPGPALSHCMRNGFAGAQANARLGSQLFPVYASKSPFLIEQVVDYPMGGLRDMSEWTIDCWNGLAGYLSQEHKLPDDDDRRANRTLNLCYALWEERNRKDHEDTMWRTREGQVRHQHSSGADLDGAFAHARLSRAGLRVVSEVDKHTGMVTFAIDDTEKTAREGVVNADASVLPQDLLERQPPKDDDLFKGLLRSNMQQPLAWKHHSQTGELNLHQSKSQHSNMGSNVCLSFSDELESQARTLFLPIAYSSFGHAVASGDFRGDGNIDLVVAAPHMTLDPLVPSQGAVFLVPGQTLSEVETSTDVRQIASRIIYGDPNEPQSRFGWSLAVVDLNRDGIDDLAIGAPGHGAKDLKYDGAVYVYFGHQGSGLSSKPDLVVNYDRRQDEDQEIPTGKDSLMGLGYVVRGLDLTGLGYKDLVLGMPMATVEVDPPAKEPLTKRVLPNDDDKDDDEEDEKERERNARFKAQAGRVLVFLSQAGHSGRKLDSDRDWELHGEDAFGWFGASLTVVSQARHESTSTAISTISSILSWICPFKLEVSHRNSRLKQRLSERRILVVGSPTFGVGEQEAMRGKIQGFVIPAFDGDFLPAPSPPSIFTIHGDAKFQQFGSSLAPNRISPSSALRLDRQFLAGVPQELLVVGSQSEDVLNRLPRVGRQWQAGMVRILDISQLQDGADVKISDLDANPDIVRDSLRGSQSMAHLSAAMEVSTDGRSLWLTEPYAKSEAGRILEWAPNFERRREGDDDDDGSKDGKHKDENHRLCRSRKGHCKNVVGVRGRPPVRGSERRGDDDDGDDDDDNQDPIKQCFIGSDFRGRFGSQLLVGDLNVDGMDDIVVTSSHASQYATMAANPLELPEILTLTAEWLLDNEIARCSRVSKLWYRTFSHMVWRKVSIGTSCKGRPHLQHILKHKDSIRSIGVYDKRPYTGSGLSSAAWEVIAQLPHLESLTVSTYVVKEVVNLFWDVCERVASLSCSDMGFEAAGDLTSRTFLRVLYLSMWVRLDSDVIDEVEIIRRCPNIQMLRWPAYHTTNKFIRLLVEGTWPALDSMEASFGDGLDAIQAMIICGLKKISFWKVHTFGHLSFQALRNHFVTLVELDFAICILEGSAGTMLQEILSSCPLLQIVDWPRVKAAELVPGRPWVCAKLLILTMSVVFERGEIEDLQPLVCEQLSRLTALVELNLYGIAGIEDQEFDFEEVEPGVEDAEPDVEGVEDAVDLVDIDCDDRDFLPYQRSFDFRLGAGLEKLATLQSLVNLNFDCTRQRMSENDVGWMIDHWKELDHICGQLNEDADTERHLSRMLRQAGIDHSDPLELPEILTLVGEWLIEWSVADVARCSRVSKLWNKIFNPMVWREISMGTTCKRQPDLQNVLRHKDSIRQFNIYDKFPYTDGTLSSTAWEVIAQLPHLKSLSVTTSVVKEVVNLFWDICERVESLSCSDMIFEAAGDLISRTFPRVLFLRLWVRLDPYVFDEVDLMRRCPNIQTLDWPGNYATDKFIRFLFDETWPALESMDAAFTDVSDEIQAMIIRGLKKISFWRVRSFGSQSFQALRNHFAALEWLDLSWCAFDDPTGAMLQEILSSCPLLESVEWPSRVKAAELVPGRSWVCTRLQIFRVSVVFERGEIEHLQPLIFEQLSRLTALVELDLSGMAGFEDQEFDIEEVQPDIEEVEPDVEGVEPDVADAGPNVADVEPDIEEVEPDIEETEATFEDVEDTVDSEDSGYDYSDFLPFQRSFDLLMPSVSPLEVPEILTMVSGWLYAWDIANCPRVSKLWYRTFNHMVWQKVSIGTTCKSQPDLQDVLKHKASIRSFNVDDKYPYTDGSTGFEAWEVIAQLPHLESFSVSTYVVKEVINLFWDICERVEKLTCKDMWFEAAGDLTSRTFPRVLHLSMWVRLDPRIFDEVDFMKCFPNIETLRWAGHHATDKFIRLLADGTWPALESMDASFTDVPDEIQATIIRGLKKISFWRVRSFGLQSFQSIRNHFATLEELDFQLCMIDGSTGTMLQEILSSCPLLESINLPQVEATDLVLGRPWVCTRLQILTVSVVFERGEIEHLQPLISGFEDQEFDIEEAQPDIERVEPDVAEVGPDVADVEPDIEEVEPDIEEVESDIEETEATFEDVEDAVDSEDSGYDYSDFLPFQRSFDFRLGRRLEKLSTLRLLQSFSFNFLRQRMSQNEISCRVEHWKELDYMFGQLHEDEDTENHLSSMLWEVGIKHHTP
ncbi:integrin subunit alpha 8 [Dissophora globulifera]|nr:integrin subunit alpha 8 [Dissophora globulifera]